MSASQSPAAGRLGSAAALLSAALVVAGCGGGQPQKAPSLSSGSVARPSRPVPTAGPTTAPPRQPGATSHAPLPPPPDRPARSCVERALAGMSPAQRVGQLFMGSVSTAGAGAASVEALRRAHVGSVMLTGHTSAGAAHIRGVVDALRSLTLSVPGATVRPLVATDQEGGTVQVLNGPGFSPIPSAVVQGRRPPAQLERQAAQWGRQLRAAGLTVNLAPVADVVPAALRSVNAPIGRLSREYGSDPATVAQASTAFLRGMRQAGVLATFKHFPGLGRVTGNTDFAANVTDTVTTRNDPYLAGFRAGVQAGTPFVMVSSAVYSRIDPNRQAAFSPVVIRGMLRGDLGFRGVVISDDLGHAAAVLAVPAGQRAVRFLTAGGDMVLTDDPRTVAPMTAAVLGRLPTDAALRRDVDDSVRRVLTAKQSAGMLTCR